VIASLGGDRIVEHPRVQRAPPPPPLTTPPPRPSTLMLLYVQPLIRIAALKTTAIVLTLQVLRISLGAEPIPVPEPFAGMLRFRRPHCKRPGCRHRGKRPGTTTALTATIDDGQHRRQAQEPGRASRRAPSGSPNGQSAMAALSTRRSPTSRCGPSANARGSTHGGLASQVRRRGERPWP
jgi:hypothetical protein